MNLEENILKVFNFFVMKYLLKIRHKFLIGRCELIFKNAENIVLVCLYGYSSQIVDFEKVILYNTVSK